MTERALISAPDLRKKLSISQSTEHRWRQSVLPPHIKIEGRCYYFLDEVEELISRNQVEVSHA